MTAPDQNANTVKIILATGGPSIHDILIGRLQPPSRKPLFWKYPNAIDEPIVFIARALNAQHPVENKVRLHENTAHYLLRFSGLPAG